MSPTGGFKTCRSTFCPTDAPGRHQYHYHYYYCPITSKFVSRLEIPTSQDGHAQISNCYWSVIIILLII
jgi:hypothetical protein